MWPLALSVLVSVLCLLYLWEIAKSYQRRRRIDMSDITEGFESGDGKGPPGVEARVDGDCYDAFYCRAYDILVQPAARAGMEVKVPLEFMESEAGGSRVRGDIRVTDIGSGTGNHVELFAREGVRSVVGYDKSVAMVAEARRRYPERSFVEGDATVATMMPADSVDLVTMYYFTIYLVPDRTAMLKNIYLWLAPGGIFCCHIVNKLKFDPVLEAASPFLGFSIQKYADERVTKSEVAFEGFDYVGDFQLHGSRAMWEEEFRFKDGRVRRHEQRVWMPNIDAVVKEITDVGFKLLHHADMTPIGYEYQYLFMFQK
jgi:SAM-dependent methyltransferase